LDVGGVVRGVEMAIVRGQWTKMLMDDPNFAFWDECSNTRHFFARLGFCKHKGEWLNAKQYFHRIYDSLPLYGDRFNIVKDD